ncbi:MAG TPA: FkbM family methyltransferase [Bacteroidota bacterium]|nr:FkbM family methyltransferase [Bacteroidota bacterium]
MWFWLAKIYLTVYQWCRSIGFNLRGAGFILRRIKGERVLAVEKIKMFFNPAVAQCYFLNIVGKFNEPETHIFLDRLITSLQGRVLVVDVGANIGEMVIDIARYPQVERVIGVEPGAECVKACLRSAELNNFTNIRMVQKVANADGQPMMFNVSAIAPNSSSIFVTEDRRGEMVEGTTLDIELRDYHGPAIFLIDVEGAEKLVILGGKNFIEQNRPIIIFEFNDVTRRFCTLEEIQNVLGNDYAIFRLRSDGLLDSVLTDTWNCVAVHRRSNMFSLCLSYAVS